MNNDTRETLPSQGSFYDLVMTLFQQKQKAALLYDDNGVTRGNGFITAVFEKDDRHWIRLNDEVEIAVDKILAINGLFSSYYSEC